MNTTPASKSCRFGGLSCFFDGGGGSRVVIATGFPSAFGRILVGRDTGGVKGTPASAYFRVSAGRRNAVVVSGYLDWRHKLGILGVGVTTGLAIPSSWAVGGGQDDQSRYGRGGIQGSSCPSGAQRRNRVRGRYLQVCRQQSTPLLALKLHWRTERISDKCTQGSPLTTRACGHLLIDKAGTHIVSAAFSPCVQAPGCPKVYLGGTELSQWMGPWTLALLR